MGQLQDLLARSDAAITQQLQRDLIDPLNRHWENFVHQLGQGASVEFSAMALQREIWTLYRVQTERLRPLVMQAVYEAARLGNEHAQGTWSGVIRVGYPQEPGTEAAAAVAAGMGLDWALLRRTTQRVALAVRVRLDSGMPLQRALLEALPDDAKVSELLRQEYARGNSTVSFASVPAFVALVRKAMVAAYVEAFGQALVSAGGNEFLFHHPSDAQPLRLRYSDDWDELEIHPNVRYELSLPSKEAA